MESIRGCELWTIKKIWRKNVKVGIFSKYRDFPIPSLEVILPSNEVGVAGVPTCEFLWLRPLLRKKLKMEILKTCGRGRESFTEIYLENCLKFSQNIWTFCRVAKVCFSSTFRIPHILYTYLYTITWKKTILFLYFVFFISILHLLLFLPIFHLILILIFILVLHNFFLWMALLTMHCSLLPCAVGGNYVGLRLS